MVARGWSRLLTALACGVGGALVWAYALTVVQPTTEPAPGAWAENNTYWARDLRWLAIVAVVCAVVLAVRGVRKPTLVAAGAGVAWVLADVWLDRLDVGGSAFAAAAAVSGTLVLLGVVGAGAQPLWPHRKALLTAAAVAAAIAPLAAGIQSPTDTEAALTPLGLAAGALLIVVALACALTAAPEPSAGRVLAAGSAAAAAVGLMLAVRAQPASGGGRLLLQAAMAGVLLTGVVAAAAHRPSRNPAPALLVGLVTAMAWLVLLVVTLFPVMPLSAAATALAGSPAVNAADFPTLYAVQGVVIGLLIGVALRIEDALARSRSHQPVDAG